MPDPATEVTTLQAIRIHALAAANAHLSAGLRGLTNADPARLLMLAETITAFVMDGTVPEPTCTCQRVDISDPDHPHATTRGRSDGCLLHDPTLAKTTTTEE